MTLQRSPELRPGAVEQHSLIRLADREDVTDVVRVEPLDIAEGDHGALSRRKHGHFLLEATLDSRRHDGGPRRGRTRLTPFLRRLFARLLAWQR